MEDGIPGFDEGAGVRDDVVDGAGEIVLESS